MLEFDVTANLVCRNNNISLHLATIKKIYMIIAIYWSNIGGRTSRTRCGPSRALIYVYYRTDTVRFCSSPGTKRIIRITVRRHRQYTVYVSLPAGILYSYRRTRIWWIPAAVGIYSQTVTGEPVICVRMPCIQRVHVSCNFLVWRRWCGGHYARASVSLGRDRTGISCASSIILCAHIP